MDKAEINKSIYDMGFKVGAKVRPPKHTRERFIQMKMNYQEKELIEQLIKFLVNNGCTIPEFFTGESKKELSKKLTVYLMGIQNGSLYKK